MIIAIGRAVAFVMGALFSLTVGQIGMRMAVQANVRVAAEARSSFGGACASPTAPARSPAC